MIRSSDMRIRFGAFELDDERFQLTRDGLGVAMRPKVFDLLLMLVRERTRVVRREELFERLWSSTAVGFGSLSGLVNELRSALGESGRGPSSIRTVHARGYQFVAAVVELGPVDAFSDASNSGRLESLPGLPSKETGKERFAIALLDVTATGARAVVACLPDERDRRAWLAGRSGEAIAVGFQPRFAAARGGGRGGTAGWDCVAKDGTSPVAGAKPSATGARVPIALCLDVDDPGAWQRAGGLKRLLDLLAGAPVLVLVALATGAAEPVAREIVADDARIECDPGPTSSLPVSAPVPAPAVALTHTLRGLARANGPLFESALRSLGFEAVRVEPIRSLRRVGSGAGRAASRRDAEAG
jgi:DNA-binding winged helix-turn-helix (wHTH) protein